MPKLNYNKHCFDNQQQSLYQMLKISKTYFFSIGKSLQALGLKTPTNKKQIKNKYLQIVKINHPDVSSNPQSKKMFIQATEAYKYLEQLDQDQINSIKKDTIHQSSTKVHYKSYEEQSRAKTYQYFNRGNFQNIKKTEQQLNKAQTEHKRKIPPLYKTVPELLIGLMLMVAILGEWSYRSFFDTKQQFQKGMNKQEEYIDIFKKMNFKDKHQKSYN